MSVLSWYFQVVRVLVLAAVTYGSAWVLLVMPRSYSLPALAVAYMLASVVFMAAAYLLIGPDLRDTVSKLPRRLMLHKAAGID